MDISEIVLKPTGTVQIINKFSLIERKLLNGIIWHSQTRGHLSAEERSLPLSEVFAIIGLSSSRNHEVIKDALTTLVGTVIRWNCLDVDKQKEWGVCTFLTSGKIRSGKMYYRLNHELVDKINNPVLFAKITILIQSQFKSRHSLVLYELLVDNLCRRKSTSLTLKAVPVDEILNLLDLKNTQYGQPGRFKEFNSKVLKPSLKEINDRSDIRAKCELVRERRRVIGLTFIVTIQEELALPLTSTQPETIDDVTLDLKTDYIEATQTRTNFPTEASATKCQQLPDDLIDRLAIVGVARRRTLDLIKCYGFERLNANLEFVELALKNPEKVKTIKNPAGYLVTAVREDWAKCQPLNQALFPEHELDNTNEKQEHQRKMQDKEWKNWVSNRLNEKYHNQDVEWQRVRQNELLEQAEREGNTMLINFIRKHGFKPGGIAMRCLLASVKAELLVEPEELSFEEYLKRVVGEGSVLE